MSFIFLFWIEEGDDVGCQSAFFFFFNGISTSLFGISWLSTKYVDLVSEKFIYFGQQRDHNLVIWRLWSLETHIFLFISSASALLLLPQMS